MRKLLTFLFAVLISGSLLAGGLVTNTNQSAMFTRLQNRNASTDIDAVYFNPAGVSRLGNGLFVSINNQTISQTRTITSDYSQLSSSPRDYKGTASAPIFPGIYVAYNVGKWSISAGFNPIGGGGSAKYEKGLPSFEMPISDLVPLLSSQGIPTTAYSADIFFKGKSVYFGYQANIGYKINDMLSVAAGVRIVSAKNTYSGYIKNVSINPNYPAFGYTGAMVHASDFFSAASTTLTTLAAGATQYVAGLQPIIAGGGGSILLSDGASAGLTSDQITQIQTIVSAARQNPAGISIAQAQAILGIAAPAFTAQATQASATAAQTSDINVDAEETGTGYTPIISVDFAPSDMVNIAVKYEFKTKLRLTTKVQNNMGGGIFFDGTKVVADMPALLAIGLDVKPVKRLKISASFNTYFDKNVDYDGSEIIDINMIDRNFLEYGLGVEYGLSDKFRISAGWEETLTSVNEKYQSDMEFDTNTNTLGAGIGYRITPMIDLNLGGQYTFYQEGSKDFTHLLGTNLVPYNEKYKKQTWLVAIGLDFHFGGK